MAIATLADCRSDDALRGLGGRTHSRPPLPRRSSGGRACRLVSNSPGMRRFQRRFQFATARAAFGSLQEPDSVAEMRAGRELRGIQPREFHAAGARRLAAFALVDASGGRVVGFGRGMTGSERRRAATAAIFDALAIEAASTGAHRPRVAADATKAVLTIGVAGAQVVDADVVLRSWAPDAKLRRAVDADAQAVPGRIARPAGSSRSAGRASSPCASATSSVATAFVPVRRAGRCFGWKSHRADGGVALLLHRRWARPSGAARRRAADARMTANSGVVRGAASYGDGAALATAPVR